MNMCTQGVISAPLKIPEPAHMSSQKKNKRGIPWMNFRQEDFVTEFENHRGNSNGSEKSREWVYELLRSICHGKCARSVLSQAIRPRVRRFLARCARNFSAALFARVRNVTRVITRVTIPEIYTPRFFARKVFLGLSFSFRPVNLAEEYIFFLLYYFRTKEREIVNVKTWTKKSVHCWRKKCLACIIRVRNLWALIDRSPHTLLTWLIHK